MFVVYQRVPPNLLLYDSFWMYICFPGSYCNFEAYRTHTFKGSNGQTHHLRLFGTHRLTGDLLYSSYGVWKSGVHVFLSVRCHTAINHPLYPFVTVVGGLEHDLYDFSILGMSSSQLTNSYFSEG